MCQLLGMNCNVPTDICFSFTGFQARGGGTDVHKDGWGIAFFEGKGVRVFLDPQPSATSAIAELVRHYPVRSLNVIAHIRKATQGAIGLENTHPFQRELWGRYWIFAHNGHLVDFFPEFNGEFMPVGQTDSERAFCWLLQSLRRRFGATLPEEAPLFAALHELTLEMTASGQCNYLLSWGESLIAHCSTRLACIERKAPFAPAHLKDQDVSVDFQEVTHPDDRVAVIATTPLTDNEDWRILTPGTLCLFRDGSLVREAATAAGPASPLTGNA
ncbi:MAG: class II glutamine amidotransferase [Azovibrio sp.]|uniref:class II glutamine amidotransferase n=1 Tax=Azovibrio sp. TaxID=1872673 RepID=UPI003C728AF1